MKKALLIMKAEIAKQKQHDYHSYFVYFSLLIWPVLGFLEVYYTYKPFEFSKYMGISGNKGLLAFLGTGFMAYTCFWSMVQNAWSMAWQERKGGTLEITFLSPANRLAMCWGRALGALIQEVWMFGCFCIFILIYTGAVRWSNLALLPVLLVLLIVSSAIWGGMLNALFLFSRDTSIIMDLFDMPMTLFSGTRIPVDSFPHWAKVVSMAFPLTYCNNIIRFALDIQKSGRGWQAELLGLLVCLGVMVSLTVFVIDRVECHNRETGELQFY